MRGRSVGLAVLFFVISCCLLHSIAIGEEKASVRIHGVSVGMSKAEFFGVYPKKNARTYRQKGDEEWLTYAQPLEGPSQDTITFHIQGGNVREWKLGERREVIDEYLGEFCSQGILQSPKMHAAVQDVLERLPLDAFLRVTDRRRPVLFTEYYDSGTARFANSSEIITTENDVPSFEEGLTIIKLSTALDEAVTPLPIEGIIAHELAHRVLEHVRKGNVNCAAEREANALVKRWGFTKEYAEASKAFGRHKSGDTASCQEK